MNPTKLSSYEPTGTAATASAGALMAVTFMGSTLLPPLYELYRREFGFSGVVLTLVYAVYVIGNLGALLLFGRLSDQIGRRRVALTALALASCVQLVIRRSTAAVSAAAVPMAMPPSSAANSPAGSVCAASSPSSTSHPV